MNQAYTAAPRTIASALGLFALFAVVLSPNALGRDPGWYNMKAASVGCRDRAQFDRITSMRISGDKEAFKKAAMAAVLRGAVQVDGKPELLMLFQRIFPGPPANGTAA